jgi:formyl-CoA transferase
MTLDIAQPEGQALVRQMAMRSDILVENFKVGGLKAYGLDFDSLKVLNPRLIYCSVTGFGQTGPYAERAGYDLMIQAMSGMMSITGQADGAPGAGPMRMGVALIDILTGIYASNAILAAIEARHTTGLGQYIDMALLDVGMAVLANQAAGFLNTGQVPQRQGNTHPSLVPYQSFDTLDGAMLLAIGNDGQFSRFCEAAQQAQWAHDPRFATNALRVKHRELLIPRMQQVTRQRTTAQWVDLLQDKAVPCGPINDLAQAFDDAQVQARGLKVNQALAHVSSYDGAIESIATVASPLRLTDTPPVLSRPPAALGEHTDEVLAELGLDAAQVAKLRLSGVI